MPSTPHRNFVEELADDFVARFRSGEHPAISEYVRRHPEHAAEIEEVFPALVIMEQVDSDLKHAAQGDSPVVDPIPTLQHLGDFRIVCEVGRGGMGIVYEAEQVSLGRRVALKVLPQQFLASEKQRKRFEREAKAAARLHHTNIVPVFGVGEQDGLHYYVMQFIHGLGLDEVIVELKRLRRESAAGHATTQPTSLPVLVGEEQRTGSAKVAASPVSAASVAHSLLSGHFQRTVLVDGLSGDSSSGPEGNPASPGNLDSDSQPSTLNSQPSIPSDTAVGQLSDTAAHSFALPGHSQTEHSSSQKVYWKSVARMGLQTAEALQYAHDQGVIHRDIKPGNLLLDTQGTVWVTDFGLAKATDQQDLTHTGDVLGTLRYMAPEQFEGITDARSDVYSLGLTLYELLALHPALDQNDRRQLIKQATEGTPARLRSIDHYIPRDLETIIHKAIDRDPSHRYQTAGDLAADLQRYLGDEPIRARWISPVTRFTRWCKRNPAVATLTTTIALLLIAVAIGSSVAAVRFQDLADEKTELAGELADALQDAEDNLALANSETQRAEGNLDLALTALDAVYLDGIGEEKLLGRTSMGSRPQKLPLTASHLSDQEKVLVLRGLGFYEQFVQQNEGNTKAKSQTAQAHFRVALLQSGLAYHDTALQSYRRTTALYEELLKEDPTNAEYLLELSRAYFNYAYSHANWDDAKQILRKSLQYTQRGINSHPGLAELYLLRGNLNKIFGETGKTLADYERALQLEPENVKYLLVACRWCSAGVDQSVRDYEKALEYGRRAVELAPNNPEAHSFVGYAYLNRDRTADQALEYFNRAVEIDPTYLPARAYRCRVYRECLRDALRAAKEANFIVNADPDYWRGHYERARANFDLGNFDQATRDIEHLRDSIPLSGGMVKVTAGKIYTATGDLQRAIESLTEGIALTPKYATLYIHRSDLLRRLKQYDEALADLDVAQKIVGESRQRVRIHYSRGQILRSQNKYIQAIDEFRKGAAAVHNSTWRARSYHELYRCQLHLGNKDEALECISKAIDSRPFQDSYRRERAAIARDLGHYVLAVWDYAAAKSIAWATAAEIDLAAVAGAVSNLSVSAQQVDADAGEQPLVEQTEH